jgi:hypothetical protein
MFDFAITMWLGGKDAGACFGLSRDWVEISPPATSMADSAPHGTALGTAKVPTSRAKSPRVAAFVGPRFGPMDRQNRRDRPNRSEFVICFSSTNIAIGGIILRKKRGIKPLRIHREVLAKGNIHPFAWPSPQGASLGQGGKPNRLNPKNRAN